MLTKDVRAGLPLGPVVRQGSTDMEDFGAGHEISGGLGPNQSVSGLVG